MALIAAFKDTQEIDVVVEGARSQSGARLQLPGPVSFTLLNSSVADLIIDPENLAKATLRAVRAGNTSLVVASGSLSETVEVDVTVDETPVGLVITISAPRPKAAPSPSI
mgnify:CR=1 FL=1